MIEPVYQLSATFEGDPGSFSLKAQDDTLDVALASVTVASRIRTYRVLSTGTLTPDMDAYDRVIVVQQGSPLTINNPVSASAMTDGRKLLVSVTDDGLSHGLFFGNQFNGKMKPLPTVTVAGKETLMGFVYDLITDKWDLVAIITQP